MKFKNTTIFLAIGVLFIVTVFFSGCNDTIEGIKKDLEGVADTEKTCSAFCDSKKYDNSMCINSDDVDPASHGCNDNTCGYDLKVFDKEDNNIKCTEDSCACWYEEECGSDNSECKLLCGSNGCKEYSCNDYCKLMEYDIGFCREPDQIDDTWFCESDGSDMYCEYNFKHVDTRVNKAISCPGDDFYCRCALLAVCDNCASRCTANGCTG